ncbi:cupin domain-containing protein [Alterisphingorhabdus coralli]|uniref:Cupin domain-containing protein n=1 Tax=Alterisphingorhabdus coralli TaxID=3071408 RepID=A0AA97F9U5_9SPHN|nr:cupin domain-containing protein [Parasphingorhabdus sp. SCSIO 66989]WOE75863.1 cupin domain-containing protein [Parasphingorhabdus sp. SCSIO 66989]
MTAEDIITSLNLSPHPEGGWYRELWRSDIALGGNTAYAPDRASATAIYYLLETGQRSEWHRVDAHELWLWHAGDPLTLSIKAEWDDAPHHPILGTDLAAGQQPQIRISTNYWQAAEPVPTEGGAGYTLVSCIVSPGFEFSGFEMRSD